ncbi:MAG: FAD-binding oxidoreductase [Cyclobacteriaceae bacterium]|nr:FAD-binding oxidoreductase [Cyclobacteriaceae bacterium]MDH4294896.1 FAD-binding oxidoreductase [Cyclobacteriaceae bacterium]MDH5248758.1 FAD-binding oxidoreductase [Cyclobacteriaceae bacterium]
MTKSQDVDYIIIGQGLAGSAVAFQLLTMKKRILVIDQPLNNTSSRIAAGLFNPITGQRVVKTWMADRLFPYLHEYYRGVEEVSGEKFLYPMQLYRPFGSFAEQNEWMAKSAGPEFEAYIEDISTRATYPNVNDVYGGLLVRQCGYLDTKCYIESVRKLIAREAIFLDEEAAENDLSILPEGIRYKHYHAGKIIFCNGTHRNKWFDWLPIRPLKGETIRILSSHQQELIINRGVYIVPAHDGGDWRVGATYNLQDNNVGISEDARRELVEKMKELVNFPFNIVGQEWGLRPTTPDRRPILGRHPELRSCFIFNGMGTKGVSLTPFLSEMLIRSIEKGEAINKEVDIERYKLLYWSSPK